MWRERERECVCVCVLIVWYADVALAVLDRWVSRETVGCLCKEKKIP